LSPPWTSARAVTDGSWLSAPRSSPTPTPNWKIGINAVPTKDGIGDLARDFNLFVAKLREMVVELKDTRADLGRIGEELTVSVQSSAGAVEEIAKTIENLDLLIANQTGAIPQVGERTGDLLSRMNESIGRFRT
jgi:methyl-accepting chemotaxis protein